MQGGWLREKQHPTSVSSSLASLSSGWSRVPFCFQFLSSVHKTGLAHSYLAAFSELWHQFSAAFPSLLDFMSLAGPNSSQDLQLPQAWEKQAARHILCPWLSY